MLETVSGVVFGIFRKANKLAVRKGKMDNLFSKLTRPIWSAKLPSGMLSNPATPQAAPIMKLEAILWWLGNNFWPITMLTEAELAKTKLPANSKTIKLIGLSLMDMADR